MEGDKKAKLFREKSLEAIESPESLNDYLHVTSAGVWLIMAAVISVLLGIILWSVFGHIDTSLNLAVSSSGESAVCYVPYEALEKVAARGSVTVEGRSYALVRGGEADVVIVTEDMNPFIRLAGGLEVGDMTVTLPLAEALEEGVYTATVVVESLKPIALLLK